MENALHATVELLLVMQILLQLAPNTVDGHKHVVNALQSTRVEEIHMPNYTTPMDQMMSAYGKLIHPTGHHAVEVVLHAV